MHKTIIENDWYMQELRLSMRGTASNNIAHAMRGQARSAKVYSTYSAKTLHCEMVQCAHKVLQVQHMAVEVRPRPSEASQAIMKIRTTIHRIKPCNTILSMQLCENYSSNNG